MPDEVRGRGEWCVGVDLGGTSAKVALVDPDGRVAASDSVATGMTCTWDALVDALAACADRLVRRAGRTLDDVVAVGVASAGLIEHATGLLLSSPNLPLFTDVPVRATLSAVFARPVTIENDATAFAYGEWVSGAARGARHAVFVTLGTGVGGGLVLDGSMHRGAHGFAGEIGHMCVSLAPDAPLCACGRTGCVEAFVGSAAIVRRAQALDPARAADARLTPEDLARMAGEGDACAARALTEAGEVLGIVLGALVNALDPEVIVVGGGVAAAGTLVLGPAERVMRARALARGDVPLPPVRRAAHGPLSGTIGAAMWARDSARISG